ncbi:uncharacterized protein BCR38DRAFT_489776 [Pseudomassariella vexata]|uniref:Fork-head domain-containing protein n=1 Tax=Pseudomassariella vexata TaxID=1141098 RepID=A0A1Y2DF74_9PEZI|nr:uncharacterized protein BCR38DRAFT_489776 [Pseudomassariella vexata]ORY57776.1 hypothetical protein BCR38DRAFT_489776 [Pseudomassariella vexata]
MLPSFCDGLPVNFATPDSTSNPRRACTTQSTTDSSGEYSQINGFYTPSPTLQVAETAHPPPQPQQHHQQQQPSSHSYPLPHIHSASSSQGMWPTPPATACEDFDDYTYQGSPASASCGIPVVNCSARSSATSPRSWSSPDTHHSSYPRPWKAQELPPFGMCLNTIPSDDRYHQQMLASPYGHHSYLANSIDPDSIMSQEAPPMTPDHPESALSPRSGSSPGKNEFNMPYRFDEDEISPPPHQGEGECGSEADDANKVDEPYAQLIYKAFMSRERHAMTLQQIYAWFRENTDKAKAENKGWQNSIRHNLSMNQAFVKRDRRPSASDATTESGEPKKSTEWVLEDWAVRDGVQSTTRYRKPNPSRRGGSGSHSRHHRDYQPSARATSGRKGGLTASKTKAAATRQAMRNKHMYSGASSHFPSSHYYPRNHDAEYAGSVKDEPATPPDASVGDILFAEPLSTNAAIPATNPGYYYSHAHGHAHGQGHGHHAHQHPHAQQPHHHSQPYTLENVTGVYDHPPAPSGPGRNQYMLFADSHDAAPESSVRVNSINYSWGNSDGGAPYQS